MYELEQLARKAGYHLYPCFSYGNRELETQAIRYLRGIGAKGMFVMPCHGSYYNTEILRLVIDGYPTVLIDKKLDGISLDSVRTDNVQSMSRLVRYFAETGRTFLIKTMAREASSRRRNFRTSSTWPPSWEIA